MEDDVCADEQSPVDFITQSELREAYVVEHLSNPLLSGIITRLERGAVIELTGGAEDIAAEVPDRPGDRILKPALEVRHVPAHSQMRREFRKAWSAVQALATDYTLSSLDHKRLVTAYTLATHRILALADQAVNDTFASFDKTHDFSRMRVFLAHKLTIRVGAARLRLAGYCLRLGWVSMSLIVLGHVQTSFMQLVRSRSSRV